MNTMRTRDGYRRIESGWPQTQVLPRRAERTRDNPYIRRQQQKSGGHPSDWVILALFIGVCVWLRWDWLVAAWSAL